MSFLLFQSSYESIFTVHIVWIKKVKYRKRERKEEEEALSDHIFAPQTVIEISLKYIIERGSSKCIFMFYLFFYAYIHMHLFIIRFCKKKKSKQIYISRNFYQCDALRHAALDRREVCLIIVVCLQLLFYIHHRIIYYVRAP